MTRTYSRCLHLKTVTKSWSLYTIVCISYFTSCYYETSRTELTVECKSQHFDFKWIQGKLLVYLSLAHFFCTLSNNSNPNYFLSEISPLFSRCNYIDNENSRNVSIQKQELQMSFFTFSLAVQKEKEKSSMPKLIFKVLLFGCKHIAQSCRPNDA